MQGNASSGIYNVNAYNVLCNKTTILSSLNVAGVDVIGSINDLNVSNVTTNSTLNIHGTYISILISVNNIFNTELTHTKETMTTIFTNLNNLSTNSSISVNYNSNQFDMTNNVLNIKSLSVNQIIGGTPTYTGGMLTNLTNSLYITYANNGTVTFPINTICNILVVGAGGKGKKGGGGAGEVIYMTDYLFNAGTYNVSIGVDSLITSNRITKIYQGATDIIKAFGGGDGGYDDVYQSISNNTYTFYSSTSLVINKTYSTTYPAGTYIFSQNQGLLKIDTTIINTYPSLTGLDPYYWFKFNGNLNDSGSSGTLLNCTATGTLTYNTYDISNISATNYINFGAINPYNVWNTYGMTFSFWIKGTATTGSSFYSFRFADGIGKRCVEAFFTKTATNDTFTFSVGTGTSPTTYIYNTSLLDNNYHYIVWSINSAGNWYIYIDNTLIINGTTTFTLISASYTNKYIGSITSTNTGTHSISVKDFRIYRGVLTSTQVNDLYLARCDISISPTSGGSGGGGSLNQTGGTAGISNNANSQLNNGYSGTSTQGGDGGSALSTGVGYTEIITGINLVVGKGGTGGTSSSVPATKTNYGDGGDGNNGNAYQGLLIINVPSFAYKTNFTGYTDWGKVENVLTSYPLSTTTGNTLTLKYDSSLSLDGSNNLKVNNPSLWVNNGTNMFYNTGNIGIGTNTPNYKLDVVGNINASDYYLNGTTLSNIYLLSSTGTSILNNLNSLSTNTKLTTDNIISSVSTTTTNINNLSTYSALNITNLTATSTTIFNNLNSLSTNTILSINNLNATTTTLLSYINALTNQTILNVNDLNVSQKSVLNGASTCMSSLNVSGISSFNNEIDILGTNACIKIKDSVNSIDRFVIDTTTGSVKIGEYIYNVYPGQSTINGFDHTQAPLTLTNQSTTSWDTNLPLQPVLHLTRRSANWCGAAVRGTFYLGRWQYVNDNTARTKMYLNLANDGYNTDVNVMAWLSNGTVGINNTSPAEALDVVGNIKCSTKIYFPSNGGLLAGPTIGINGGVGDRIVLWPGDATSYQPYSLGMNSSTLWYSVPLGANHRFYIAGGEKLTVSNYVGVSNSSPIAVLSVGNSAVGGSDGSISIGKNNGSGGSRQFYIGYNSTFAMCFGDWGNFNTPGSFITQFFINYGAPTLSLGIYADGNVGTKYGNVVSTSDERLKTNIKTIDNALEKTCLLRGVSFTYIQENKDSIGLIAQEVENIIPEVVHEYDGIKSLAYSNLVGLLVEAIKEQQTQINELKNILKNNNIV